MASLIIYAVYTASTFVLFVRFNAYGSDKDSQLAYMGFKIGKGCIKLVRTCGCPDFDAFNYRVSAV